MIKFILIFLADLEKKLKKAKVKSEEAKIIEVEYERLKKEIEPKRKALSKIPSFRQRAKAAIKNVGNIVRNAYDNSVGYVVAQGQNWKTRRHYRKDPKSEDRIVYLMHGLFQTEGSQRKFAKQLRKAGYQPYHLRGNHHLSRKESAEKGFGQIDKLHKDTKLKDRHKRSDYFSGHSSGADVGIYMAGDKRMKEYGIAKVQARAPVPYGMKAKRIGQRLLVPFASKDNIKKAAGKRNALELAARKPTVPVDVIAGRYDGLVPPSDAVYQHAKKHYVIEDPDSTHFGTSGVNSKMNQIFIDNLRKKPEKEYRKKAA